MLTIFKCTFTSKNTLIIVRVSEVLRWTVAVEDWHFDNPCRSHLQSQLDFENNFHTGCQTVSHVIHSTHSDKELSSRFVSPGFKPLSLLIILWKQHWLSIAETVKLLLCYLSKVIQVNLQWHFTCFLPWCKAISQVQIKKFGPLPQNKLKYEIISLTNSDKQQDWLS